MSSTQETGRSGELVSKETVNKILYEGYQRHLHDCANSVRAAEFIHELQRAVTALPPEDLKQLAALREGAAKVIERFEREYQELTDGQYGTVEDFSEVAALRTMLLGLPEVEKRQDV